MKKVLNKYNIFGLAFLFWLVLIVAVYVATAIYWLRHPFNYSYFDIPFSICIISSMLLGCVVCIFFKRRSYIALITFFSLLITSFIIMAILSKAILSLLVFIWILVLGVVMGERVINLILKKSELSWLEMKLLSIAIGFGIFSLFILGLAEVGLLYPIVVYITLILLSVIFLKDILRLLIAVPGEVKKVPNFIKNSPNFILISVLLSFVVIMMFFNFIGAIAPSIQFDSLNYHLTVPKIYINYHHIVNLPNIMQSYFAKSIEMLYGLGMIMSDQIAAKLISFGFGVFATLTLFCIGKRFFSITVAVLAMTLFYLAPLTSWLSTTTYIELAICFYVLTTLLVLMLWQQQHKKGFLLLCGLLAGFALSAKIEAGLFILPMGLIILASSYWNSKKISTMVIDAVIFGLPILLLVAPWYLVTYVQTGNPIFPFFNAIFKSPLLPLTNKFMNLKDFGVGYGLKGFLTLPWHLTYSSSKFIEASPDGVIGVIFLLAMPALFFIRKHYQVMMLFFIVLFSLIIWFFIGQYLRYIIPLVALLALLGAYAFAYFINKGSLFYKATCSLVLIISLLAAIPIYLVSFWNIPTRAPYKVALGLESRAAYLTDTIRTYQASVFLNKHYDPSKIKIVLVGTAFRFYLNTAETASPWTSLTLRDFPQNATLPVYLHKKGFTHILIDTFAAQQSLLNPIEKEVINKGYAKLVYKSQYAKVYQLVYNHIPKKNSS